MRGSYSSFSIRPLEIIFHFFVYISAWSNMKLSREIEDRRRLDQIQFERAGTAPIVRTYKFDPTKIKKSAQ